MAQFGRVVQSARGVDRSFRNVFDGIFHFTIQLHNYVTLPHLIDIEDEGGHLAERLFVFPDQHHRCCFCCGHTGHAGQFCRAAIKSSGVIESLWSRMVLRAGAPALSPEVHATPQPSPLPASSAAAAAPPPPCILMVPMPGSSTVPSPLPPPPIHRDRVYFGIEY
jgi:hypothetical protein